MASTLPSKQPCSSTSSTAWARRSRLHHRTSAGAAARRAARKEGTEAREAVADGAAAGPAGRARCPLPLQLPPCRLAACIVTPQRYEYCRAAPCRACSALERAAPRQGKSHVRPPPPRRLHYRRWRPHLPRCWLRPSGGCHLAALVVLFARLLAPCPAVPLCLLPCSPPPPPLTCNVPPLRPPTPDHPSPQPASTPCLRVRHFAAGRVGPPQPPSLMFNAPPVSSTLFFLPFQAVARD